MSSLYTNQYYMEAITLGNSFETKEITLKYRNQYCLWLVKHIVMLVKVSACFWLTFKQNLLINLTCCQIIIKWGWKI